MREQGQKTGFHVEAAVASRGEGTLAGPGWRVLARVWGRGRGVGGVRTLQAETGGARARESNT